MSTKYSWKTSLCGIIGVFFVGAEKTPGIPPWLAHVFGLLAASAPSIGLLFARDNDRTSEQVGAAKNGSVIIVSPSDPKTPTTGP